MAFGTGQITKWQARRSDGWRGWKDTNVEPIGPNTNAQAGYPDSANKLTMCLQLKIPDIPNIKTITSITVPMYVGENYDKKVGLYGTIRTLAPLSDGSETLNDIRTTYNIGEGWCFPEFGGYESITNMTLRGDFDGNSVYYLYLYTQTSDSTYRFEPYESANYPFEFEYELKETYIISYDANGGTDAPSAQIKTEGETLTLSAHEPTGLVINKSEPEPFIITGHANGGYFHNDSYTSTSLNGLNYREFITSYTFLNWNTKPDGSGVSYNAGGTYEVDASVTLYAQYSSSTVEGTPAYDDIQISDLRKPTRDSINLNTYTVTYDTRGGNSISYDSAPVTREWVFEGWATSDTATSADAESSYHSDTTLYAYWEFNDIYTTLTLPTPTKNGYTFVGWATSPTANSGLAGGSEVEVEENITYYALWIANGLINIYIKGEGYRKAWVYLYVEQYKKWYLVIPYLYNSGWKICT